MKAEEQVYVGGWQHVARRTHDFSNFVENQDIIEERWTVKILGID
jgi:hypothetical protein